MQAIVVAKPYKFVAPHRGNLWPKLLRPLLPRLLRNDGIASVEFRGAEKLAASLSAGHLPRFAGAALGEKIRNASHRRRQAVQVRRPSPGQPLAEAPPTPPPQAAPERWHRLGRIPRRRKARGLALGRPWRHARAESLPAG